MLPLGVKEWIGTPGDDGNMRLILHQKVEQPDFSVVMMERAFHQSMFVTVFRLVRTTVMREGVIRLYSARITTKILQQDQMRAKSILIIMK